MFAPFPVLHLFAFAGAVEVDVVDEEEEREADEDGDDAEGKAEAEAFIAFARLAAGRVLVRFFMMNTSSQTRVSLPEVVMG